MDQGVRVLEAEREVRAARELLREHVEQQGLTHHQNSAATLWIIDTAQRLPFQAQCLDADTLIAKSPILTPSGARRHALPYIELQYGSDKDQAAIVWPEAVKGKPGLQLRCDR